MTLLAADVPNKSILTVFGTIINKYECAGTASTMVNGIMGRQGE